MVQITRHSLQRRLSDNNTAHHLQYSARSYTTEAVDTLVALMRAGKGERVRGTAAQALLDRGWGKAKVEGMVLIESGSGWRGLSDLIGLN